MAADQRPRSPVVQKLTEAPEVPGRRETVKYYDLGAASVTGGDISATYVTTTGPLAQPSGWHYHGVEAQIIHMIKGWFDIEFEDGTRRRIDEGCFALIPGGMRHNEVDKSPETEAIEIVVGTMSTHPCDVPEGCAP